MSSTERKVASLAVAARVVPFAFAMWIFVVGDTSSGNIAFMVSAFALFVAGQMGPGLLQRRLWPGHARLHDKVHEQAFYVCFLVFGLVAAAAVSF